MTNGLVGFLAAVGFGAWVYSKVQRRTGGNTKQALIVAGIAAVFALIVVLSMLAALDNYLSKR